MNARVSLLPPPALLVLFAVAACGAAPPGEVLPADELHCAAPVGYRGAIHAVLPGSRIVEYEEAPPDTGFRLLASFAETAPPGYRVSGPWLHDRLYLVIRTDLGRADTEIAAESTTEALALDEREPLRLATSEALDQRLAAVPESAAERTWWAAARRYDSAEPLAELWREAAEAALLDGPAFASFTLSSHRLKDRLAVHPLPGADRVLWLAYPLADSTSRRAAELLRTSPALLEGLGYAPAF